MKSFLKPSIILLFLSGLLSPLTGTTLKTHPPVNPDASPAARSLLDYLYSISGKSTLSGQHNYPGTISDFSEEVHSITGKRPVIWGQDFGFTASGQDGIDNRDTVIEEAIRRHQEGSIITLMWHAVRPIDDEPNGWKSSVQNELTDAQWVELVTPGTPLHLRWLAQLDRIAEHLKTLKEHGVPVLWRPYHEMNGAWFWWGKKPGEEGYQKLWRLMYQRFVDYHELNNLIWVWNANGLVHSNIGNYTDYFPGTDVVDVLATDVYGNRYDAAHPEKLQALAKGKPIAIGECGVLPTPEILEKQPDWTWFMCWTTWLTDKNTAEEVRALYSDPRVITLETLQRPY